MFIAFREPFHCGWHVWVGGEEITTLPSELKRGLHAMSFDEKASHLFRLSVWINKRDPNAQDITGIPDGTEIFVERVTSLNLFDNKLAQGNTSRIELIIKVDGEDSEADSVASAATTSASQSSENQADEEASKPGLALQPSMMLHQREVKSNTPMLTSSPAATKKADRENKSHETAPMQQVGPKLVTPDTKKNRATKKAKLA